MLVNKTDSSEKNTETFNLSIVEGETSSLSIGAYTHIMLSFLVIGMKNMCRTMFVQLFLIKQICYEHATASCKGIADSLNLIPIYFFILFFSLWNLCLLLFNKVAVTWNLMKGFLPSVQNLLNSLFIILFSLNIKKSWNS